MDVKQRKSELPNSLKPDRQASVTSESTVRQTHMSQNYNWYFKSGAYGNRYPRVNRNTLQFIEEFLSGGRTHHHILDYGCGSGRYLFSLISKYNNTYFTAFDISSASLNLLQRDLIRFGFNDRVSIKESLHESDYQNKASANGKTFDTVLMLFGVLSHIHSADRKAVLSKLRRAISETDGDIVLSVPNRKRRFLFSQWRLGTHEIEYTRIISGKPTHFYYHLYDQASICAELVEVGLEIVSVRAESLLPESWVTRIPWLGRLDQLIAKFIPPNWGYGILVCARAQNDFIVSGS